jgi:DNA-binding response OmpR family regulator
MTDTSPTVIAVDDEPSLTDLYEAWLDGDYDVRTAQSGIDALSLLKSAVDPAVVLLDREMPELTGDELLVRLRERGVDCPVVLVTGLEPRPDVVDLPFDDYLCKPVSRSDLVGTVEASLVRRRYDGALREYFALARKKAVLETSERAREFRRSEAYRRLVQELERAADEADLVRDDALVQERPVEYE